MEKQFINLSTIIGTEEHSLHICQEPLFRDDKHQYIERKLEDPKQRKLRLQSLELQRKQKIQKTILQKELKVNQRLSIIKNEHKFNKTLRQQQINRRLVTQKIGNTTKQSFKSFNTHYKDQQSSHIQPSQNQCISPKKKNIPKQNIVKIYTKTTKNKQYLNYLPSIHQQKAIEDLFFPSKNKQAFNIINFGIFPSHKSNQIFLHKLKQTLSKQFIFEIDLKNENDFNRLQSVITNAIYQEGKQFQ